MQRALQSFYARCSYENPTHTWCHRFVVLVGCSSVLLTCSVLTRGSAATRSPANCLSISTPLIHCCTFCGCLLRGVGKRNGNNFHQLLELAGKRRARAS